MRLLKLICLGLPVLWSCNASQERPAPHRKAGLSFYYWKTSYLLDHTSRNWLDSTGSKRMYVRFFDLDHVYDYRNMYTVVPLARIRNVENFRPGMDIVPVVYITQSAMSELKRDELDHYAALTVSKIKRLAVKYGAGELKEIQLDCDWTSSTRDTYFAFVEACKREAHPAVISVTLRLYQYKYRTTSGIPPANRVMLMYYNMGSLKNPRDKNYILDNHEAELFIKNTSTYPLPMDVALPLYKQARRYSGGGREFRGFISPGLLAHIRKNYELKSRGKRTYVVMGRRLNVPDAVTFLSREEQETYNAIEKYDELVIDQYSVDDLKKAAGILRSVVNTRDFNLVFYHLDEAVIKNFKLHELEEVNALLH